MKTTSASGTKLTVPSRPKGRPPTDPAKLRVYKASMRAWKDFEKNGLPLAEAKPTKSSVGGKKAGKPAKPKASKEKAPASEAPSPATPTPSPTPLATPSPQKKLSAADLPAIIELFQSMGTMRLTGDGYDLKLTARTANPSIGERNEKPGHIEGASVNPVRSSRLQGAIDQEALRDMELSQKLIDSPLEYEQAQIDAHLGQDDGGQETDHGRETERDL